MKELGDTAAAEHEAIGADLARAGIDVLLVGRRRGRSDGRRCEDRHGLGRYGDARH